MAEEGDAPESKKIFLNAVDLYHGDNFAKYLSNCVVGESLIEQDEEGNAEEELDELGERGRSGTYKIVGVAKNANYVKPSYVYELLQCETREELFEHVVECDVIIYDVSQDFSQMAEAAWCIEELHANIDNLEKQKVFILVSTVMTWARTKVLDPDNPDVCFTEEDYRKRKPHPNFRDHIALEKSVIKYGKTNKKKLVCYVVAAGLSYGAGEHLFHFLFKQAWHNSPELECYGDGKNVLPVIHVQDLAGVLQNVADSKPKTKYIVACDSEDDTQFTTLEDLCRSVSGTLGTGRLRFISKEDALLVKDLQQSHYDMLLVDLRMNNLCVRDFHFRWKAKNGFVENISLLVSEFKETRRLLPLKICVLGPPAVGKTTLCKQLCQRYKLHLISIKEVIEDAVEKLEKLAAMADQPEGENAGYEEDAEVGEKAQEAKQTLDDLNEKRDPNTNKIDDSYVIKFYREKLLSKPCQNQGFVLDGFPKTREQAKALFNAREEEEDEGEEEAVEYDKKLMVEFVYCLEATDEFLRDRIMNLPEREVAGTHNTEDGLRRRLELYREINTEDETVLNYFDQLEIHPEIIDAMKDSSEKMADTLKHVEKVCGEPRNYGPTEEELEEMRRKADEEAQKKEQTDRLTRQKQEEAELEDNRRKRQEWSARLEEVKREETELLEAQSLPLRNYLMKHVMPTLTEAMIECCKVRPDDGIDFIAEYLFTHNPQID